MATFGNEEELKEFLTKIHPVYGAYSSVLFQAGVNDPDIIGTADVADLTSLNISRLHATNLIANCKATGPPPLLDGAELLQRSMVPPQALPSAEGFRSFLLTDSKTLRVPVSQEAADFLRGTGDETAKSFVAASKPLEMATAFLGGHTVSGTMEEGKTTSMMSLLLDWLPREIFHKLGGSSPYRVQSFDVTGNKTEKIKVNPSSALSKELQRPDMLCFVGGATALIGEDNARPILTLQRM